jgi:hypothetical protein
MHQPIGPAAEAPRPLTGNDRSVRAQFQRDVERPSGVGEGAQGDDIDARLGDGADRGQRDAAGRFRQGAAAAANGR